MPPEPCLDCMGEADKRPITTSNKEVIASSNGKPAFITSAFHEFAFLLSLTLSAIITAALTGAMSIALPAIESDLNFSTAQLSWVQSSYSLVTGAFLLLSGSLADIVGRKKILLIGSVWLALWCLIAGFSGSWLIICRALQGLGAAMMLPASIGLLSSSYTGGSRRNVAFAIYGSGAPVGFSFGVVFGGVCSQFLNWRWIMWCFAILSALLAVWAYFSLPQDQIEHQKSLKTLDWIGASLVTSALILLIFSLTSATNAKDNWRTPYIIVTLILSVILLLVFFYVQRILQDPLVPPAIWRYRYLKPISFAMFVFWGGFGVLIYYATLTFQIVDHSSPLLTTAKILPMAVVGTLVNVLVSFLVGRIKGWILLTIAGMTFTTSLLLFSEAPTHLVYWGMKFPALCLVVVGADFSFNIANLFCSASVSMEEKALAGGILSTVTNLGTAFGLAFTSAVSGAILRHRTDEESIATSFRNGLRTGAGLTAIGLLTILICVRVDVVGIRKSNSGSGTGQESANARKGATDP